MSEIHPDVHTSRSAQGRIKTLSAIGSDEKKAAEKDRVRLAKHEAQGANENSDAPAFRVI
jgi:hypothetical protein